MVAANGRLYYCASRNRTVCIHGGGQSEPLPGYTRGLCCVGEHLYVGTSVGRKVSKSTGLINNPADPGAQEGICSISRLSAETLAVESTVDLSHVATEIYDLLPVEGAENWPVVPEAVWQRKAFTSLCAALDKSRQWAQSLRKQLEERDARIAALEAAMNNVQVERPT